MIIDILGINGLSSSKHTTREVIANASILYEMPHEEGNERPQKHNHEEWQTGNSGYMLHMRHKDVQNWKELNLDIKVSRLI